MHVDRALVVAIIRDIRDAIIADRATGIVRRVDPEGCEIVRRACAEHGVAIDAWVAVLHADVELLRLFEAVVDELMTDPPDPGPYDQISRESPTGVPGVDQDAFERDARLLGVPHR